MCVIPDARRPAREGHHEGHGGRDGADVARGRVRERRQYRRRPPFGRGTPRGGGRRKAGECSNPISRAHSPITTAHTHTSTVLRWLCHGLCARRRFMPVARSQWPLRAHGDCQHRCSRARYGTAPRMRPSKQHALEHAPRPLRPARRRPPWHKTAPHKTSVAARTCAEI